jgi:hypothetical protein
MAPENRCADLGGVKLRTLLGVVAGALTIAALVAESGTATAGARCGSDVAGNGGYTYAGYQAADRGHGVRATITATSPLEATAGHVAGWVGVGGPGQGVGGEDAWIQVGIASAFGTPPFLYAEITRGGRYPRFIPLDPEVSIGETRSVAVLEVAGRPGWWRVWVDRKPVTKPVKIRGSSGRWAPIATAESFSGGKVACNSFAFRFEHVLVSNGPGGAWSAFESGYRFLDGGNRVRTLATTRPDANTRQPASVSSRPLPYAFVATS